MLISETELVRYIDARIRTMQRHDIVKGTAAADSSTGSNTVMVIMDGSALAVPVKLLGGFQVYTDDRVALVRYGSEWVVIGTFNRSQLGLTRSEQAFSSGSTSSGTPASMPGWSAPTFTKAFDNTHVLCVLDLSCYVTVAASTGTVIWVRINGVDRQTTSHFFGSVSQHMAFGGQQIWEDGVIPAGAYTVDLLWERYTGTGTINTDSNDHGKILVWEGLAL